MPKTMQTDFAMDVPVFYSLMKIFNKNLHLNRIICCSSRASDEAEADMGKKRVPKTNGATGRSSTAKSLAKSCPNVQLVLAGRNSPLQEFPNVAPVLNPTVNIYELIFLASKAA